MTGYLYNNPLITKWALIILSGIVVFAWFSSWAKRKLITSIPLSRIDRMSGTAFERYLVKLYRAAGYNVTHLGGSGDYGADLIISQGNKRVAIQAKRYSNKVSLPAVQQIYTACAFYDCNRAIVVTNSYFTRNARRLADKVGVELIDRDELTDFINDLQKGVARL